MERAPDLTALLVKWLAGDQQALELLLPLAYQELRRIAARQLHDERAQHTLVPTALVHELYLRLVDQRRASWENRAQFFGVAAQLMRRILVDHARARRAGKRGGLAPLLSLDGLDVPEPDVRALDDVIAIDEALEHLAARDPEQARIVELRFFAGLSVEEVAHLVGRSARTVKREWRLARAWLFRELHGPADDHAG